MIMTFYLVNHRIYGQMWLPSGRVPTSALNLDPDQLRLTPKPDAAIKNNLSKLRSNKVLYPFIRLMNLLIVDHQHDV